jgi:hypothetical protein
VTVMVVPASWTTVAGRLESVRLAAGPGATV